MQNKNSSTVERAIDFSGIVPNEATHVLIRGYLDINDQEAGNYNLCAECFMAPYPTGGNFSGFDTWSNFFTGVDTYISTGDVIQSNESQTNATSIIELDSQKRIGLYITKKRNDTTGDTTNLLLFRAWIEGYYVMP